MKVSESTFSPESVRLRLISTWNRLGRARLWTILLTLGGTFGLFLFFFSALEHSLWLSPIAKLTLWGLLTITLSGLLFWMVRFLKRDSHKESLWKFSSTYNQDPVRYLIDLAEVPVQDQTEYHKAAIRQNLELISSEKLTQDLDTYVREHPFS